MFPLRFPWVWWGLGWLMVAFVSAGSLLPGPWVPTFSLRDKVLHAGAYFLLMVWFSGLYRRNRHLWIALFLFALGFALDLLQGASVTRTFDLMDVAANAGGILTGLIISRYLLEGWCHRVEKLILA